MDRSRSYARAMPVIAHVSDIHIDNGARSIERTRAVFDYLNALPGDLDAVIVTGDIADHGLDAEYQTVRELTASRHPVLVCPGNHDDREAFRRSLLGVEGSPEPINQVLRTPNLVIALVDSSIPRKDEGFIEDSALEWLEAELARTPDTVPVLVGFHHPPILLHTPYVDAIRQFGPERLAEVVARFPNVVALLCGHAHTAAATTFDGLPLLVAPGVISTMRLPVEGEGPLLMNQPPAFAFHIVDDERRITTHYRHLD